MSDPQEETVKVTVTTTGPKAPGVPLLRHRLFWLLAVGLVLAAEVVALFTKEALDVLSASMWWLYGERYSARWWYFGSLVAALLFWCPPHWLYPEVGERVLLVMVAIALVVATVGWLVTR